MPDEFTHRPGDGPFYGARPDPDALAAVAGRLQQLVDDASGADGALVLMRDGLALAFSDGMDQTRAERLAASLSGVLALANRYGHATEHGRVESLVCRFSQGSLMLMPVTAAAGVVLLLGQGASPTESAPDMAAFCADVQHLVPDEITSQVHRRVLQEAAV